MNDAWFNDSDIVTVDQALIDRLKQDAGRNLSKRMRFCLHQDLAADLHEMVIAVAPGGYLRPHQHPHKSESFHVIEGRFWLLVFDDNGEIIEKFKMGERGQEAIFLYRLEPGYWHTIRPLTDFVVLHEVTRGPFVKEEASLFPSWAPDGNEPEQVRAFHEKLDRICGIGGE